MKLLVAILLLASRAAAQGAWTVVGSNKVVCIHTMVLPNDTVLCVERPHNTATNPFPINPFTDGRVVTETRMSPGFQESRVSDFVRLNPFCAGHAQMADGSVLIIGGDMPLGNNTAGETILTDGRKAVRRYVPCQSAACTTGSFEFYPDMTTERWYVSVDISNSG